MKPQRSYFFSIIPIIITIGFLLGIFGVPTAKTEFIKTAIAILSSAVLYGVDIYYVDSLHNSRWHGYKHVATGIALLTTGLANALYMIIAVSITVALVKFLRSEKQLAGRDVAITNTLGWISLSGITVISEFFVYTVILSQSLPFAELTLQSALFVVFSLAIGNVFSVIVGILITQQSSVKAIRTVIAVNPPHFELVLLFLTAVTAATLYQVGEVAFIVIIIFTIIQVFNSYRVTRVRHESTVYVNELKTLNNVAQALSVHIELDDVLASIYTEMNQLVDAHIIFVAFYDDETSQITYPMVKSYGKTTHWPERKLANGLTDFVIRNQQQLYIYKSETERINKLGIESDLKEFKTYLGFPMTVGEKITGVIGFLHFDHTNILGDTNINVLQSVVNQASLALRNATLYDGTTNFANNLSFINQSVQEVMFNLNREGALNAATQTAQTITNADQVAVFLVDMTDKITLNLAQYLGTSDTFRTHLSKPELEWFDSTDTYRLIPDINEYDDPYIKELSLIGNFQAFAEIPMGSTTTVGYLHIYHQYPHQYSKPDLEMLEMLTSQLAIALDNTELLQALEVYALEQAELVHLSNITSSSLELESVINDVSKALINMLTIDRVDIGLYVQGRSDIYLYSPQTNLYLDVEEHKLAEFPELQIEPQDRLQYPKILLSSDPNRSSGATQYMAQHRANMLTIVPMIVSNEAIGAIVITDPAERLFDANERRLLEMASTQIAAQVHNAQIHTLTEEALVKRLEQLALIEDILQKISRSLNLDLIITNVLEAALRSTQADVASLALVINDTMMSIKSQEFDDDYEIVTQTITRQLDSGIIGEVIQTGKTSMIDDNRKNAVYIAPPNNKQYLSSLTVPLTKGAVTLGAINIESNASDFFTDEHVGFIKSLAGHAIISIDNAKLLENSKRRIAVLTQLRTLALKASESQTTDEIINTVVTSTIEMMAGSGGILIPYSEENQELTLGTLGWIKLGSGLAQDVFFIPQPLLHSVLETGTTAVIHDINQDESFQNYAQLNQVNYKSLVIIPIIRRSQIAELLCITFNKQHEFDKLDYDTFELLQAQIANHIDGVMLAEEIHASNVRMRAILDSTRDGIILLDREGRLQDANISAEELTNIELTRFRNQNFEKVLTNHGYSADDMGGYEELIETARKIASDLERNRIREYTLQSNGSTIYIREVSSPVWNNDDNIVGRLLSLRDVSEERKLEEFREHLQRMIVHDLKTPLANIVSRLSIGESSLPDIRDVSAKSEMTEMIDWSKSNATELLDLVESMLDIGKMQRNQLELKPEVKVVKDFATASYISLMTMFQKDNIDITYHIPDDLPKVYVDESLVRRVFKNIVGNALKFTNENGEIRVTAHVDEDNPSFVKIMISDSGTGIPKGQQEQIFKQYVTIDNQEHKQQRGRKGTGLGLTFCKLAVEAHNGHIYANNDGPLSGATFYFTLPIAY